MLGQRAGGLHDATRAGRGLQVGWTGKWYLAGHEGWVQKMGLRGFAEGLVGVTRGTQSRCV